jgi:hypothetical protein
LFGSSHPMGHYKLIIFLLLSFLVLLARSFSLLNLTPHRGRFQRVNMSPSYYELNCITYDSLISILDQLETLRALTVDLFQIEILENEIAENLVRNISL